MQFKNQATARQRKRAGRLGALAIGDMYMSALDRYFTPALSIPDFPRLGRCSRMVSTLRSSCLSCLDPRDDEVARDRCRIDLVRICHWLDTPVPRISLKAHYETARGLSSYSCDVSSLRQLQLATQFEPRRLLRNRYLLFMLICSLNPLPSRWSLEESCAGAVRRGSKAFQKQIS